MLIHTPHGTIVAVMDPDTLDALVVRAYPVGHMDRLLVDAGIYDRDRFEVCDNPDRLTMTKDDFTDLLYAQVLKLDHPASPVQDPPLSHYELFMQSLPREAWLDDGTLDPDYLAALP